MIVKNLLEDNNLLAMMPNRLYQLLKNDLKELSVPIKSPTFDVILAWHKRTDNSPLHNWIRSLFNKTFL